MAALSGGTEERRRPTRPGTRRGRRPTATPRTIAARRARSTPPPVERLGVAWRAAAVAPATRRRRSSSTASSTRRTCGRTSTRSTSPSGRVRWRRDYEETDIGPNGVNVVDGRVFGATATRAFALDAETGRAAVVDGCSPATPATRIDMAPGYHDGTVYVSTGGRRSPARSARCGRSTPQTGSGAMEVAADPRRPVGASRRSTPAAGCGTRPRSTTHGALYVSIANPLPFPGAEGYPWGDEPAGAEPLDELDRQARRRQRPSSLWGGRCCRTTSTTGTSRAAVILDRVDGRLLAITAGKMGYRLRVRRATAAGSSGRRPSASTTGTTTTTCSRCVGSFASEDADEGPARAGGAAWRRRWRPTAGPSTRRSTTSP